MIERLATFLRKRGFDPNTFATVFDIGSRDALQAVELSNLFPRADVVAVECNRATIETCRKNVAGCPRIRLIEKAINSFTGRCTFHPIDPERTITTWPDGNPGASSLFIATGDYPAETYVQDTQEVECTRLDDLCRELGINVIDLIWMDLQGAELIALQSAGTILEKTRYIYTEVSHRPIYEGQCLFDEVDAFMTAHGFRLCTRVDRERWQQDVIYENRRELIDVVIPVGASDRKIVEISVRSIQTFVKNVRQIYVVSAHDPQIGGTSFVAEDIFPFSRDDIRRAVGDDALSEMYLKQLIKLSFASAHQTCLEHVLAVDADTVFLRPIRFLEGARSIFSFGDGYKASHFEHMERLFSDLPRMFAYSATAHCMLLKRSWLSELHRGVEMHHEGIPFWEAYLRSINLSDGAGGASEAEIYFNFCLQFHSSEIVLRRFLWSDVASTDELQTPGLEYVSLKHQRSKRPADQPCQVANRHHTTIAQASAAIGQSPNNAKDWQNLGRALFGLKKYNDAINAYDQAIKIAPLNAQDWTLRASALSELQRYDEAVEASDQALALDSGNTAAARVGIHSRLFACDWSRRERDVERITDEAKSGRPLVATVFHRALSDSEVENLAIARLWACKVSQSAEPVPQTKTYRHEKIRLGYISTDFRDHVVSDVIVGCLEHHDKARFETIAISLGPDDGSDMRQRIKAAFDEFIDAQNMSDAEVATLMRDKEIDIAIDLNGNSGAKRTAILAHRAAPVQVNYLGYPGTMALPFIDYIIADKTVIPEAHNIYYTESVVRLPHTYFPADRTRTLAASRPSRAEAGLPATGFVFACHNASHKFEPSMFAVWMRLLQNIEGSVLWLRSVNSSAMANLRREAARHGVSPGRLLFAPRVENIEAHLARLTLADLFLDTLPYNAHATASDALWVGLPVLTCIGNTFAGRVAASLLRAIGLPELITSSLDEYEELALALVRDSERLANLRRKLLHNRDCTPLFDTEGYTRNLEAAFLTMWQRQQQGLPPAGFTVTGSANA